jgi:energy-coupling factor transport system ATP-binding protein
MSGVHVSLEGNHILKGFDFSLGEGDLVVVAGRNGSGKTTAMLTLANAIKWQNGSVENKGKVSYVFQHPQLQTVAPTIKQELELEPKILKWDENKTKRFVDEILAWLNLDPDICPLDIHSADRRLLMIGASSHGSILILDEPTIDLDTEDTVKVLDFIQKLRLSGTAVVLITHDHDLMNIANRVVMIDDGRVKDEYVPQEVEIERPVVYSQV